MPYCKTWFTVGAAGGAAAEEEAAPPPDSCCWDGGGEEFAGAGLRLRGEDCASERSSSSRRLRISLREAAWSERKASTCWERLTTLVLWAASRSRRPMSSEATGRLRRLKSATTSEESEERNWWTEVDAGMCGSRASDFPTTLRSFLMTAKSWLLSKP